MPNLFYSQPGVVTVLTGPNLVPALISLQTSDRSKMLSTGRVIITEIQHEQAANVQFQQSLYRSIYLYSFGDKISDVSISGLAFAGSCLAPGQSGVEDVLGHYSRHRVSRNNAPVFMSIGQQVIRGFLCGCRTASVSAENLLYSWSFKIAAVPLGDL